jgi:hypothetical protein
MANSGSSDPFAKHRLPEPVVEATTSPAPSTPFAGHEHNERKPKPARTRKPPPAPKLFYWLQRSWTRPIISLRQIITYGPWSMRDRASALAQAELLEQAGWLIPAEDLQYEHRSRVWRTHLVAIPRL